MTASIRNKHTKTFTRTYVKDDTKTAKGSDADFKAFFHHLLWDDMEFWPAETVVSRDEVQAVVNYY